MAERAGLSWPWRMQNPLDRTPWNAHALRAEVRAYAVEPLGYADGALVVDETATVRGPSLGRGCAPINGSGASACRTARWACSWPKQAVSERPRSRVALPRRSSTRWSWLGMSAYWIAGALSI